MDIDRLSRALFHGKPKGKLVRVRQENFIPGEFMTILDFDDDTHFCATLKSSDSKFEVANKLMGLGRILSRSVINENQTQIP